MLAANEAKRQAQNNIDNCVTKELDKIDKLIAEAVSNGKFSICNDGVLQSKTKEMLKSLGYRIETGSQYNEAYYSISWS